MIKSMKINNFQSHKESSLKFHPGVNVIIGKSDSGKTAIIRALRWLFTNRPTGEHFRSNWGGDTLVEITTDDNYISRFKSNKENIYCLDKTEFKAIGKDVPEEIKKALNIDEVNLQSQFDHPFLLKATAGEVAAHFNKIAHLSQIDESLKQVNQWARAIEQSMRGKKEQLILFETDLQDFQFLDKMEIDIEVLEQQESRKLQLLSVFNKIKNIIESLELIEKDIEENSSLLPAETLVNILLNKYKEIEKTEREKLAIDQLIEQGEELKEEIKNEEDLIKDEKLINFLLVLIENKEGLTKKHTRLLKLIESAENSLKSIKNIEKDIIRQETILKSKMSTKCPLCEQTIEKWKWIDNWENIYEISNLGRVRSYYKDTKNLGTEPKLKEQTSDRDGYKRVGLYKEGKSWNKQIHRLVLTMFIKPCPVGMEASHLDGDRTNNRLDNLKWETHLENEKRKIEHGTRPFGSRIFTDDQILKIKQEYKNEKISHRKLAKKYKVCECTIRKIINNKEY